MKRSDAFTGKGLGKDDLEAGPIVVTIQDVGIRHFENDDGHQEKKPEMTFSDHDKAWLVNFTNWMTCEDLFGEDTDDWIGHQIELFVDNTVLMKGKRVGGVRCRAAGAVVSDQPKADTSNIDAEGEPTMTQKEAKVLCLENDIDLKDLGVALKAEGYRKWNDVTCTPVVRNLVRIAKAAKAADALDDNDIPF